MKERDFILNYPHVIRNVNSFHAFKKHLAQQIIHYKAKESDMSFID